MLLYREDLEELFTHDVSGCRRSRPPGEACFRSACHIDSPTQVRYLGDVLTIECAECGKTIATVVVASREDEPL